MEREKTKALYTNLIDVNQQNITILINMSDTERNSLEGVARYQFAAIISDASSVYANVVKYIDPSVRFDDLRTGEFFRIQANEITRNIPIGITINYDRANRIRDAFARVISQQGFRSGGNNSRYMLQINFSLSSVDIPNPNNNLFARYEVNASLIDTLSNTVIVPFNVNGREGHLTMSEAENRAVASAERRISSDYNQLLASYLANLLPVSR